MRKYDPEVFAAMRRGGLSNRRIGALLNVDESNVRRALLGLPRGNDATRTVRDVLNELAELLEAR